MLMGRGHCKEGGTPQRTLNITDKVMYDQAGRVAQWVQAVVMEAWYHMSFVWSPHERGRANPRCPLISTHLLWHAHRCV